MGFTHRRQLPAITDAIQVPGCMWRGVVTWGKRSGRPCPPQFPPAVRICGARRQGRLDAPGRACLPAVYDRTFKRASAVHLTSTPVGSLPIF